MYSKNYQNLKIKRYIKNYSLVLITNSINRNAKNQMIVKQELKKLKLSYYKAYNKLTTKIFKNSTYKNAAKLIYSPLVFIVPKNKNFNISTLKYLKNLSFSIIGIKINKQLYSTTQIKNLQSANYLSEMSLFYQFLLTNLKWVQTNKKSKQCDLNT